MALNPMPLPLPYSLARLDLRPLAPGDLQKFLACRNDSRVARYQGWEVAGKVEAEEFISRHSNPAMRVPGSWCQIAIADKATDKLIGDAGIWLSSDSSTAEFGMSLARNSQGQGFGSETANGIIALLFEATTVTEILAHADVRTIPCLKALKRAGMLHTGERQKTCKGELGTESCFAVSRAGQHNGFAQARDGV